MKRIILTEGQLKKVKKLIREDLEYWGVKGSEAAETLKQNRKSGLYDKIKQAKKSNQQKKDTLRDRLRKKLRSESFISENIDWITDTEPSDFGYGVYDSLKDAAISQLGDYNNISLGDNVVFEGDNFSVYAVEVALGREIVTLKNQRTDKNFQIVIYDPLPPEWEKELPPIREEIDGFDWDEVLRNQRNEKDDKYHRLEQDFRGCVKNLQEKYSRGENMIGRDSYAVIDVMKQILPQLLDEMFQEL